MFLPGDMARCYPQLMGTLGVWRNNDSNELTPLDTLHPRDMCLIIHESRSMTFVVTSRGSMGWVFHRSLVGV